MCDGMWAALSAILGYALGTFQVLLLDWFQRRRRHRTDLRTLRSELRRTSTFARRFDWDQPGAAPEPIIPRAPNVSATFEQTVTSTEFVLTDPSSDSNLQEVLLTISDNCRALDEYLARIRARIVEFRETEDPTQREQIRRDLHEMSAWYDLRLDPVQELIRSTLENIELRLQEATMTRQLKRLIR